MKDSQKPDHVALNTLVGYLREGRYVVPDFQREFEWKAGDIQELMRSIFCDYYIGSLLLWDGKLQDSFDALACQPLEVFDGDSERPEYIVLDGQQRLTAMYYAFMAPEKPLRRRSNQILYFIRADRFMEKNYDEAFEYDWTRQGKKILEDENAQFEKHLFPLKLIGSKVLVLAKWLQNYEEFWQSKEKEKATSEDKSGANIARSHAEHAKEFGEYIMAIVGEYQVSYIELKGELAIEKVCDIFTRINSQGVKLDIFDLMNAVLKPCGLQLKDLYREAESRLDFVETPSMNVYVLQVMSILLQSYCSPKYLYYLRPGHEKKIRDDAGRPQTEILIKTDDEFKVKWYEAVQALEKAIKVLHHPNEFGVITSKYLPYASILPVFAALINTADRRPHDSRLSARKKINDWYWASIFLKRYSSAFETKAARDYQDVKSWFEDDYAKPKVVEEFREEFHNKFRNPDFLQAERRRGSSIYIGIFNLFVLRGARDWISGAAPQHSDLDDHHIVPQKWGKDNQCEDLVDSILNRTLLTAESNREIIRDRLPCEYLPEMIKKNGESKVLQILETHLISKDAADILLRNPFKRKDFDDFLNMRRDAILDVIKQHCVRE